MIRNKKNILILGGSGIIGSEISKLFFKKKYNIKIIDNLHPLCFGSRKFLSEFKYRNVLIKKDFLSINSRDYFEWSDVIINSIGWTRHSYARNNYEFNKKVNYYVVKKLINDVIKFKLNVKIIHLSTLSQFNLSKQKKITDKTLFKSSDAIGIMKAKSEELIKKKSLKYKIDVVCLRLGNCFNKNLPIEKKDSGLIASLITDLKKRSSTTVFGKKRVRNLAFIPDIARFVEYLSNSKFKGYVPINFLGKNIFIENLIKKIICNLGYGKIIYKEMPSNIKKFDTSFKIIESRNFNKLVKNFKQHTLNRSLKKTLSNI